MLASAQTQMSRRDDAIFMEHLENLVHVDIATRYTCIGSGTLTYSGMSVMGHKEASF